MNGSELFVAVIPCFNEGTNIHSLIKGVQGYIPKVIVVDDGSTDHTAREAARAGAQVIRNETNLGKGSALRLGLALARELGFHRAFTLDGDGQHAPTDIPVFLRAAEETGAALIVGNRLAQPQGMPWLRLKVNRWMSAQLSRRAGCLLPDSQCGFRLIELNAWSALRLETEHFEIESEMLLAFRRESHGVEFVPIQVTYKNGQSKIDPLLDSWRWFRWWWQTGKAVSRKSGGRGAIPLLWSRLTRLKQDTGAEVK